MFSCISCSQKAGEDQHTFRVDRAAELYFPLDVDDLSFPHSDTRRNSRSVSECKVSQLDYGKSINLADLFSLRLNQQCSSQNFFQQPFAHTIGAANLGVDRTLDVFLTYASLGSFAGPVVRF